MGLHYTTGERSPKRVPSRCSGKLADPSPGREWLCMAPSNPQGPQGSQGKSADPREPWGTAPYLPRHSEPEKNVQKYVILDVFFFGRWWHNSPLGTPGPHRGFMVAPSFNDEAAMSPYGAQWGTQGPTARRKKFWLWRWPHGAGHWRWPLALAPWRQPWPQCSNPPGGTLGKGSPPAPRLVS